jgi:GT2 family glycosyltransferase
MMEGPECTVLIPSHGGAIYLRRVLNALAVQTRPDFDVVVIDNNTRPQLNGISTDVFGRRMRIIHEPQVGLSRARNVAVAYSQTKYVAFLDDDTVPAPSWLMDLLAGLKRHGAAVAGGAVDISIQGGAPPWLGPDHRRLLAELNYEGVDIPSIRESQYICGGNLAAATRSFEVVGPFAESFGRMGSQLRSSEELEWCRRAQSAGLGVAFIASARVEHLIGDSRLKVSYFLRRGYWQGRSDALLECRHGRPAEFGMRSNRRNVAELMRRSRALFCALDTRTRVAEGTALARELGYCIQYAQSGVSLH